MRSLKTYQPDVVLLDLSTWPDVSSLASQIRDVPPHAVLLGFRSGAVLTDVEAIRAAGIVDVLPAPFSPQQLQAHLYDAVHAKRPINKAHILGFLPAKAGGGCSTVALNTAAALSRLHPRRVLLMEADRRSGVLSILLNLPNKPGLGELLRESHQLTQLVWADSCHRLGTLDILPSNPFRPSAQASWASYYQLLLFIQNRYDYIIADLPEVVNPATAEIVRNANSVFIVCTPELPSLAMASLRSRELEDCEIAADKVHVVVNRFERRRLSTREMEETLERKIHHVLPNDYREVKEAIHAMNFASPSSPFGRACVELAASIESRDLRPEPPSRFAIFRKLSLLTH